MYTRFLKESVVADLRVNIRKNLPRYRNGDFNFLNDQDRFFEDQSGAIEETDIVSLVSEGPQDDPQNSEIVFKSCEISRYAAADARLWSYLCHTYGLNYCRARWDITEIDDDDKAVTTIRAHFFAHSPRSFHRDNALSRLWWNGMAASRYPKSLSESLATLLTPGTDPRAQIIDRTTTATSTVVFNSVMNVYEKKIKSDRNKFFRRIKSRGPYKSMMGKVNALGGLKLLPAMTTESLEKEMDQIVIEVDRDFQS